MRNLPYFIPNQELELNVALLMIVLFYMAKTKHGKFTANNEKLLIYMFLLKNPTILNEVLINMNKGRIELSDIEYFSVESIAMNSDVLFDISWLKKLLQFASSKNFLKIIYKKTDGFLYELTDNGVERVVLYDGNYFNKVKKYAKNMQKIQSEPTSKLNEILNDILIGKKL